MSIDLEESNMQRKGISLVEIARLLGLAQIQVYAVMQKGQLTSRKMNGRVAITPGSLMEYHARKLR